MMRSAGWTCLFLLALGAPLVAVHWWIADDALSVYLPPLLAGLGALAIVAGAAIRGRSASAGEPVRRSDAEVGLSASHGERRPEVRLKPDTTGKDAEVRLKPDNTHKRTEVRLKSEPGADAQSRWGSPTEAALVTQPNPLPWVALAGLVWLAAGFVSQGATRPARAWGIVILWTAVAVSAVAIGEAYAVQQIRREEGRSRLAPWFVPAGGLVLFLVQPLLTPMIALAIALIRRAELRE